MNTKPSRRTNRGGRPGLTVAMRLAAQERHKRASYRPSKADFEASVDWEDGDAATSDPVADRPDAPPGLPVGPSWVATPTSSKVLAALQYAQLAGDIAVIYGGAGLGKSKAIERYQHTSMNVFAVELAPTHYGLLASLEEIAIAVGIRDYVRSGSFLHRAICRQLRGAGALLIIDEAQHLGMRALDQIRSIHDQSKVGLALVGNELVYTQLAGRDRAAYLDRLYSRIGKRVHLRKSAVADADALAAAWHVHGAACRARIREIASKPGALRVLSKVLRLAAIYAQGEDRRICLADIEAAWVDLGSLD